MAEVYVITNKVNGNQYVGKTNRKSTTRLREHFKEMHESRSSHRPLYRAMHKYGIEQFDMRVVKTGLTPQEAESFEVDLIAELDTFNNGYNATIGGDGKTYRFVSEEDVAYIIDLYVREDLTLDQIAKKLTLVLE